MTQTIKAMLFRKAISKFKSSFDDLEDYAFSSEAISNDGSRTSLNVPSKDLPPILSNGEDDSIDQLQKRNLFQSLQNNTSDVSLKASSLSIKSGTSSLAQSDSSAPIDSNSSRIKSMSMELEDDTNSTSDSVEVVVYPMQPFSSTSVSHYDVPMIQPSVTQTSQSHDDSVQLFSSTSVSHQSYDVPMIQPTQSHDDSVQPFSSTSVSHQSYGVPMIQPTQSHDDSVQPFSSTSVSHQSHDVPMIQPVQPFLSTSVSHQNDVPMIQPTQSHDVLVQPFSSTSVSHQSYDVPMIQPTQSHDDSVIHNDDNLDDQQHTSEMNNRPDSTIPSLTWKKLLERDIAIVREISVPGDFVSDKPSTSPNVQSPPLTTTDGNIISPKDIRPVRARRKPNMNSFLLNLVEVPEKVQPPQTQQWRPSVRSFQHSESGDSLPFDKLTDDILAQKMEQLGRLRRMQSRDQSKTSPETLPSTATSKAELRPQLQTLQEDNSSDVTMLLREAYMTRQQTLQTQLDKALAELRDVRAENKRLTSENQSQQRSISQLKIALDESKHEQDNSTQIKNQLRDATSSLTLLNKEKKGWQDKLDTMRHKLDAAERQVRCLDHLTRHKLESRQEAGYGPPKRRGLLGSIPASTDIIGAMRALNEEIYQTCVQFVEGLERSMVFSTKQKSQVQKVLGNRLTAMMEDQAKKSTSGYNMLLMQTVLEVFMAHWCSSIIEAFYPQQESFADLLVQLSAQTTQSGLTAVCGKQIKIIQSSTPFDNVKFNEWVNDIIKDLGHFLTTAGLRMKTQLVPLFATKTLALVQVAYDLRTAMAERDICGGLEVVVVQPDTPFQEKWMTDAHADPRKVVNTDQSRVDFVAGTSGIGLQRKVSETVGGQFQSRTEIELKPKVILARALNLKN